MYLFYLVCSVSKRLAFINFYKVCATCSISNSLVAVLFCSIGAESDTHRLTEIKVYQNGVSLANKRTQIFVGLEGIKSCITTNVGVVHRAMKLTFVHTDAYESWTRVPNFMTRGKRQKKIRNVCLCIWMRWRSVSLCQKMIKFLSLQSSEKWRQWFPVAPHNGYERFEADKMIA